MSTQKLDNMFTDDDKQELNQLQKLRSNLLRNIGLKNFIDLIRNLIDDSESFEFTSASKRKFINLNTPIFTIRKKDYIYDKKNNEDVEINNIVKEINHEILSQTTAAILNIINTDEELKNIYGDINESLKDILWTTIFEIRVSLKDNIIYLRYCI